MGVRTHLQCIGFLGRARTHVLFVETVSLRLPSAEDHARSQLSLIQFRGAHTPAHTAAYFEDSVGAQTPAHTVALDRTLLQEGVCGRPEKLFHICSFPPDVGGRSAKSYFMYTMAQK